MIGRVELIVEKVASCEKLFEKLKTNFGSVSKNCRKGDRLPLASMLLNCNSSMQYNETRVGPTIAHSDQFPRFKSGCK